MENRILTSLLVISLTLGFLSLTSGYLPAKMPSMNQEPIVLASARHKQRHIPHFSHWRLPKQLNIEEEAKKVPLHIYTPLSFAPLYHYSKLFSPTKSLQTRVEFWRNVFANYDTTQTILHDSADFNIVYGILNFEDLEKNENLSDDAKRALRTKIEEIKKNQLKEMLLDFYNGREPLTAGEHLVYDLFDSYSGSEKFKVASERIRSQGGQKSKFADGLIRSGRYMPMIEAIFEREGVPREVSHLAFVESMFTLGAVSKVGAAGPWQFMPKTAKRFDLTMNTIIDERRDPIIAAQAAARLLRKNYDLLQSWPLAINAYNTGPLRMLKAIQGLETRRIDSIIDDFTDGGYQFASKNFYPEFLAALEVASHFKDYFGTIERDEALFFDELTFPFDCSVQELASITATDIDRLKDLNPAYNEKVFKKGVLVPKGYTIRVPHQQKENFLAALNEIQNKQQAFQWHVVRKGESLLKIAKRYHLSVQNLMAFNGLKANYLQNGQVLKIPSSSQTVMLETSE